MPITATVQTMSDVRDFVDEYAAAYAEQIEIKGRVDELKALLVRCRDSLGVSMLEGVDYYIGWADRAGAEVADKEAIVAAFGIDEARARGFLKTRAAQRVISKPTKR